MYLPNTHIHDITPINEEFTLSLSRPCSSPLSSFPFSQCLSFCFHSAHSNQNLNKLCHLKRPYYSIRRYIVFIISGYQRQPQYSRQHTKRQNFRMLLQSWSCIHNIQQMRSLHRKCYSIVIIIIIALNQVAAHKRNEIHTKNYISKVSSKP